MVFNLKRSCALGTGLLCVALVMASRAEAGGIAITTPAGLLPGETFRIVFVTDGTMAATSTNIADYNSFVNGMSGADGATYDGVTVTWSAIASTAMESASANIGSIDTPIYLSNGTLVSAASDLWSGSLTNPINTDLAGTTFASGTTVFTGATASGGIASIPLGSSFAEVGDVNSTTSNWISYQNPPAPGANADHFYAISGILTVDGVPEPSSLFLGMTAIGAGLGVSWVRKYSAQRRMGSMR